MTYNIFLVNDLNKEITDIFDKACDETVKILAESNISRNSEIEVAEYFLFITGLAASKRKDKKLINDTVLKRIREKFPDVDHTEIIDSLQNYKNVFSGAIQPAEELLGPAVIRNLGKLEKASLSLAVRSRTSDSTRLNVGGVHRISEKKLLDVSVKDLPEISSVYIKKIGELHPLEEIKIQNTKTNNSDATKKGDYPFNWPTFVTMAIILAIAVSFLCIIGLHTEYAVPVLEIVICAALMARELTKKRNSIKMFTLSEVLVSLIRITTAVYVIIAVLSISGLVSEAFLHLSATFADAGKASYEIKPVLYVTSVAFNTIALSFDVIAIVFSSRTVMALLTLRKTGNKNHIGKIASGIKYVHISILISFAGYVIFKSLFNSSNIELNLSPYFIFRLIFAVFATAAGILVYRRWHGLIGIKTAKAVQVPANQKKQKKKQTETGRLSKQVSYSGENVFRDTMDISESSESREKELQQRYIELASELKKIPVSELKEQHREGKISDEKYRIIGERYSSIRSEMTQIKDEIVSLRNENQ